MTDPYGSSHNTELYDAHCDLISPECPDCHACPCECALLDTEPPPPTEPAPSYDTLGDISYLQRFGVIGDLLLRSFTIGGASGVPVRWVFEVKGSTKMRDLSVQAESFERALARFVQCALDDAT